MMDDAGSARLVSREHTHWRGVALCNPRLPESGQDGLLECLRGWAAAGVSGIVGGRFHPSLFPPAAAIETYMKVWRRVSDEMVRHSPRGRD